MSKLVRDNIPMIMKKQGKKPNITFAAGEEYWNLLIHKLYEEIVEFTQNPSVEELADISEVIIYLGKWLGIEEHEIKKRREEKKIERGGFDSKTILISEGDKYE